MSTTPTILPMGTLGTGKSTFLNRAIGQSDEDGFKTSSGFAGCTQDFAITNKDGYDWIDSPGLNDPKLPVGSWIEMLKEEGMRDQKINMALIFIKPRHRPENSDKMNVLVLLEAISKLEPENIGVVFTHCDIETEFERERKGYGFVEYIL